LPALRYTQKVDGIKQRVRSAKFQEHYNQAQLFLNSLSPVEKKHMISAFCFELSHCDDERVAQAYSGILQNIDMDLAKEVAEMVNGIPPERQLRPNHGKKDVTISQDFYIPSTPTVKGRRVAILVADGFNTLEVEAVRVLFKSAMTMTWVVGPRRNTVYPEGQAVGTGIGLHADHHFEGQRSTMFDAIYIPSGAEHAKKLASNGRAIHWIREAFGHCKAIAASGEGKLFLTIIYAPIQYQSLFFSSGASVVQQALGLPEMKFAHSPDSDDIVTSYGVVTTGKYDVKTAASDALHISADQGFVSRFAYEISQHRCWQRELDGLCDRVAY
jgi:catalase